MYGDRGISVAVKEVALNINNQFTSETILDEMWHMPEFQEVPEDKLKMNILVALRTLSRTNQIEVVRKQVIALGHKKRPLTSNIYRVAQ